MAYRIYLIIFSFFQIYITYAQADSSINKMDSATKKKVTIGEFCLCYTSLSDLFYLDKDLQEVAVEEMDAPSKCIGQDMRYENGKGYYSSKFTGIVFQKDQ